MTFFLAFQFLGGGGRPLGSPSLDTRLGCIVLYYIVLYCIVFHCIALYCIVLHCIALYCIVLHCIALYCIVLYCIVLYCIVLYRQPRDIIPFLTMKMELFQKKINAGHWRTPIVFRRYVHALRFAIGLHKVPRNSTQ